jgi:basic membrane lipoprotein Med (substrate-binding protein (PBP1-ABC) superfamily)
MVLDDKFEGGNFIASLENGRVGIAYGSVWEDKIPSSLKAEIEDLESKIISGEISASFDR